MSVERHELHEQDVAPYVLRALSEEEHTRFVRHLRECHVCRDEVDRLQYAVDALPRSAPPMPAPRKLKESIMSVVKADVREREPASLATRLRERVRRLPAIQPRIATVTAAVLLALGVAGGFGLSHVVGNGGERVLAAKFDSSRVANGSGSLVIGGDAKDGGTLRVHGMPKLRSNETYQVWLQRDGEVIPKALFTVSGDGTGLTAVDDLGGADRVMVTREPAGGARSPSGPAVVSVKL